MRLQLLELLYNWRYRICTILYFKDKIKSKNYAHTALYIIL